MATVCVKSEERRALLSQECSRALALIAQPSGFGGIARHLQAGRDCRPLGRWPSQTNDDLERQEQDRARQREEVAQPNREHAGLGPGAAVAPGPVPLSDAHAVGR